MSKIFCGVGKVPKKSRRGTMRECAEKKQIRYYGIKKIDAKTLDLTKNKNSIPETRIAIIKMIASLQGLIRRNKTRCQTTKNMDEKENYCKLWKDAEKKLKLATAKYKKLRARQELEKKKAKSKSKSKKRKTSTKTKKTKKAKSKKQR